MLAGGRRRHGRPSTATLSMCARPAGVRRDDRASTVSSRRGGGRVTRSTPARQTDRQSVKLAGLLTSLSVGHVSAVISVSAAAAGHAAP